MYGNGDPHSRPYEIALKGRDADEFYKELQVAGVELVSEPRDIPWGRTFLFRAPDGHQLRAYSSLQQNQ
ncbi:MAG: hypothetical protein FVQ83_00430 [Chloroflexi bacterium]|nr:hypothetical protein [Chloroflexota bacterium]